MEAFGLVSNEMVRGVSAGVVAWGNRPAALARTLSNGHLHRFRRIGGVHRGFAEALFLSRKILFYECDELTKLPVLNGHSTVRVESFDGVSAVPDEVAEVVEPHPGETISVLFIGRRICGYVRAAFKHIHSPDIDEAVEVTAGEVYLYDLHMLPEYQSTGLMTYLLSATARHFLEKGFSRVITAVLDGSPQLRVLLEKSGFRLFQRQNHYRILGKTVTRVTTHRNGTSAPGKAP